MSLSGEAGGVSGGVETTPIPSYLITCYPFVQENQPNRYCQYVRTGGHYQNGWNSEPMPF